MTLSITLNKVKDQTISISISIQFQMQRILKDLKVNHLKDVEDQTAVIIKTVNQPKNANRAKQMEGHPNLDRGKSESFPTVDKGRSSMRAPRAYSRWCMHALLEVSKFVLHNASWPNRMPKDYLYGRFSIWDLEGVHASPVVMYNSRCGRQTVWNADWPRVSSLETTMVLLNRCICIAKHNL